MQKNQIYILLAKISSTAAILSACALILSWIGRSLMGTHAKAIGIFILALCLSILAVVAGILALVRLKEEKERRIAWFGMIAGFTLLVPMGAVGVIFLIIVFSG